MDVFREGKFELLALEAKLKGNGEVSWCAVNGIMPVFRKWEELRKGWPSC